MGVYPLGERTLIQLVDEKLVANESCMLGDPALL